MDLIREVHGGLRILMIQHGLAVLPNLDTAVMMKGPEQHSVLDQTLLRSIQLLIFGPAFRYLTRPYFLISSSESNMMTGSLSISMARRRSVSTLLRELHLLLLLVVRSVMNLAGKRSRYRQHLFLPVLM